MPPVEDPTASHRYVVLAKGRLQTEWRRMMLTNFRGAAMAKAWEINAAGNYVQVIDNHTGLDIFN